MNPEQDRLTMAGPEWKQWGPYVSERAWGTVREDYSAGGEPWTYFTHDQARSRAYRWSEDGLAGICDDQQRLCLALGLWNGKDDILKERLFGLSGPEGNHGEDVKECYWYLDSAPTHSYLKMVYRYPQAGFPYARLVAENAHRGRDLPEYELSDTGVFTERRFFDVQVEYAKDAPDDIYMRVSATNRGPDPAPLWLLPTLWFRNTWSWPDATQRAEVKPMIRQSHVRFDRGVLTMAMGADHPTLGEYHLLCAETERLLFTDNETNVRRLFGAPNVAPYVKDAFHEFLVYGNPAAVNPALEGSKGAALYQHVLQPGETWTIRLRLVSTRRQADDSGTHAANAGPLAGCDRCFEQRIAETDAFYAEALGGPGAADPDLRNVQRQALAGMLWNKQYYHYDVSQWLCGDACQPAPPPGRETGRNHGWRHLVNADIISMPDKWEYPWYASWDLGFHCIGLALVDPEFAKDQLVLVTREWYQHPNGQIPAYEWGFGDVNPPVLGWAAWRVFELDRERRRARNPDDGGDTMFLERVFHKLLINFTWWVNRKDAEGNNIFEGGFLGLDNIGVFDRNALLPNGGHIEQSDGTGWMGMYALNLMRIALELAATSPAYEDIASKFFEHFLFIAGAMNNMGGDGAPLWDDDDEFFYDILHMPGGPDVHLRARSMVGLIPLFAVETIDSAMLDRLPGFRARLEWFLTHRPDLAALISSWREPGMGELRLFALARGHRMKKLLRRALDPAEFLGDYGVRSLSKIHASEPYVLRIAGMTHVVRYEPAESRSALFGGNSNWRGPIWLPLNFLLIESLHKFHAYYGDDFKVECPTGSGQYLTLSEIAGMLSRRLIALFAQGGDGVRPAMRSDGDPQAHEDRERVLFHEYFDGDTGAGLGASHQTGWTGLVAELIRREGDVRGTTGSL